MLPKLLSNIFSSYNKIILTTNLEELGHFFKKLFVVWSCTNKNLKNNDDDDSI